MAMNKMAAAPMARAPEAQTKYMVAAPASTVSSRSQPRIDLLLVRVLRLDSRVEIRC